MDAGFFLQRSNELLLSSLREIMRWTNYFIHPGDNRYYVFSFGEDEHADAFAERLEQAGIAFERHLEETNGCLVWHDHTSSKP